MEQLAPLTVLLSQLEAAWLKAGMPTQGWLADGLNPALTARTLAQHQLAHPTEILDWFAWHNGTTTSSPQLSLGPSGYQPLSLNQALTCQADLLDGATAFRDQHGFDLDTRPGLERHLLPLAHSNDPMPSALAADLRPAHPHQAPIRVISYWDPAYHTATTTSIAELIHNWLQLLRAGATWSANWRGPRWSVDSCLAEVCGRDRR